MRNMILTRSLYMLVTVNNMKLSLCDIGVSNVEASTL